MSERYPVGFCSEYDLADGRRVRVEKIADGLGFGDGSISRKVIEAAADPDLPSIMHTAITDRRLLQPISRDKEGQPIRDDGCGDGRLTGIVMRGNQLLRTSLLRPKVFGGGLAQVAAGRIGLGLETQSPLTAVMPRAHDALQKAGMDYGGHTVTPVEAHSSKCGCGCLDQFAAATSATSELREQITPVVSMLMNRTVSLDEGDSDSLRPHDIFDNFGLVATMDNSDYSGAVVIRTMLRRGKVIKALIGPHLETDLVINEVPDTAVDEELVRSMSGGQGQTFAVDRWRMRDLADGTSSGPSDRMRTMFSMDAFTLGVSAVLAAGDQRVWRATQVA